VDQKKIKYEELYWTTLIQQEHPDHKVKMGAIATRMKTSRSKIIGTLMGRFIAQYEEKHGIIA